MESMKELNDNKWHTVSKVSDGKHTRLYIDGNLKHPKEPPPICPTINGIIQDYEFDCIQIHKEFEALKHEVMQLRAYARYWEHQSNPESETTFDKNLLIWE